MEEASSVGTSRSCDHHRLCASRPNAPTKQALADFLLEYMEVRYPGLDIDGDVLYVSVRSQRMYHVRGRMMHKEYVISTSAKGLGGSDRTAIRTPTGLHYVRERIGEGLPALEHSGRTANLRARSPCMQRNADVT